MKTGGDQSKSSVAADPVESLADGLPTPRRYWAGLTILLGIGICVIDAAMVNVALPTIAQALAIEASTAVWIINAFQLTVVVTLLPFSSLAERVGFKRLFRFGLIGFWIGAIGSALSPSIELMLIMRVLQGLGASAIMCLFGGLMRHVYPAKILSRGIAINAMNVAVTSVLGPTLGSTLLSFADWRWIFVVLTPLIALTAYTMQYLPDVATITRRFDYRSAVLSAIGIGCLILGLDYLTSYPVIAMATILFSLLLIAWLVRWSSGQSAPLVPVDLLKIDPLRAATAASACSFAAQMATFVSLPFYLQTVYGHDPMTVGVLMASWPLGAAVMAFVAGRLADRVAVSVLCGLGASAMALSTLAIILLPQTTELGWLMAAMALGGVGFGFFQTPNNRALLGSAPRQRAGAVGGLQALTRVFGQTAGAALVATAFAASQSDGPSFGLIVGMGFALLALVVNVRRYFQESRI